MEDKEKMPFLSDSESQDMPKYLELLYEREIPYLENDGYEIPNQLVTQIDSVENCSTKPSSLRHSFSSETDKLSANANDDSQIISYNKMEKPTAF